MSIQAAGYPGRFFYLLIHGHVFTFVTCDSSYLLFFTS